MPIGSFHRLQAGHWRGMSLDLSHAFEYTQEKDSLQRQDYDN